MTWGNTVQVMHDTSITVEYYDFITGAVESTGTGMEFGISVQTCPLTVTQSVAFWVQNQPPQSWASGVGTGMSLGMYAGLITNGVLVDRVLLDFFDVTDVSAGNGWSDSWSLAEQFEDNLAFGAITVYEDENFVEHCRSFMVSATGDTLNWEAVALTPTDEAAIAAIHAMDYAASPGDRCVTTVYFPEGDSDPSFSTYFPVTDSVSYNGPGPEYLNGGLVIDGRLIMKNGDDDRFEVSNDGFSLNFDPITMDYTDANYPGGYIGTDHLNELNYVVAGELTYAYGFLVDYGDYDHVLVLALRLTGDTLSVDTIIDTGWAWGNGLGRPTIGYGYIGSTSRYDLFAQDNTINTLMQDETFPDEGNANFLNVGAGGVGFDYFDLDTVGYYTPAASWQAASNGALAAIPLLAYEGDVDDQQVVHLILLTWVGLAPNLAGEFEESDRMFWRHRP